MSIARLGISTHPEDVLSSATVTMKPADRVTRVHAPADRPVRREAGRALADRTVAQIGSYARPSYRKAATLSDRSAKPLDVTDWVWTAGGGNDLDGHIIQYPLARTDLIRGIRGCCLYEALERSLEASAG